MSFNTYTDYFGKLAEDNTGTVVYGYKTGLAESESIEIPAIGGCFIVVQKGSIQTTFGNQRINLSEHSWQTTTSGAQLDIAPNTVVAIFQKLDYYGLDSLGKIELDTGRLKYINGCFDTILFQPIKKGLPCMNTLFMPSLINQTMHTHPSTRAGIILKGKAYCETPKGQHPLSEGVIFFMPKDSLHKFRTDIHGDTLNLAAFHPDSDSGPTDDLHIMLNRTIVEGVSANKLENIKTK